MGLCLLLYFNLNKNFLIVPISIAKKNRDCQLPHPNCQWWWWGMVVIGEEYRKVGEEGFNGG